MTIPVRKFGVEIEFIGVYPQDAAAAITAAGVPCAVEGYNHATRNHWKIVSDASIQVNSNMEPGMCGELVSPPLCDEQGLMQLRTVIRALASVGGTVNKSCGLHVHVDANDLNAGQILSVVRRYAHFENQINAFMPPSRRGSRWAHSVGGDYVDNLLRQVNRYGNPRNIFGGLNRYMAVNLASYARHGTVEFRQHSGSTNPAKVANWVTFCLHFVNKAIQAQVLPAATPVVENTTNTSTARARRGRVRAAHGGIFGGDAAVSGACAGVSAAAAGGRPPRSAEPARLGAVRRLSGRAARAAAADDPAGPGLL